MAVPKTSRDTTPWDGVVALFCGAGIGALVTAAGITGLGILTSVALGALDLALFAMLLVFVIYLVGLFAVAAPVWIVLHRCGVRSGAAAVGLGATLNALPFFPMMVHANDFATTTPPVVAFIAAEAAAGAIVGWSVWRIAYGRPEAPR